MGDAEDVGEREGEREKERDGEGEGDGDGEGEGDGDGEGGEEGEERKSVLCGGASRRRSDPVERLVVRVFRIILLVFWLISIFLCAIGRLSLAAQRANEENWRLS